MLTLAVAVTASVFAIWPVVADAPWEDKPPTSSSRDEVRCQAALDLRAAILKDGRDAYRTGVQNPETYGNEYRRQLDDATREIARYC